LRRFVLQISEQSGRATTEECTFKIFTRAEQIYGDLRMAPHGTGVATPEIFGYFSSLKSTPPEGGTRPGMKTKRIIKQTNSKTQSKRGVFMTTLELLQKAKAAKAEKTPRIEKPEKAETESSSAAPAEAAASDGIQAGKKA
jgi:hypothetical protein